MPDHLIETVPREFPIPPETIERMSAILVAHLPDFDAAALQEVFATPDTLYECTVSTSTPEEQAEAVARTINGAFQAAALPDASVLPALRSEWVDKAHSRERRTAEYLGIAFIYKNFRAKVR